MQKVGIRELKSRLSYHLKRVRSGEQLLVTERGRTVATITPAGQCSAELEWVHALVAAGEAHWEGGKPSGCRKPVAIAARRTVSGAVLEDRR